MVFKDKGEALRMTWSVKREGGKGAYPKQRALQGKALSLEAVGPGQGQVLRPARVAGAGCRREWPELWLQKGPGAGQTKPCWPW